MAHEEIILDENTVAKGYEFADVHCCIPNSTEEYIAYAVDYSGNEEYVINIRKCSAIVDNGIEFNRDAVTANVIKGNYYCHNRIYIYIYVSTQVSNYII